MKLVFFRGRDVLWGQGFLWGRFLRVGTVFILSWGKCHCRIKFVVGMELGAELCDSQRKKVSAAYYFSSYKHQCTSPNDYTTIVLGFIHRTFLCKRRRH